MRQTHLTARVPWNIYSCLCTEEHSNHSYTLCRAANSSDERETDRVPKFGSPSRNRKEKKAPRRELLHYLHLTAVFFIFVWLSNMEVGATVTHADCASADGVGMPPHSWSQVDPSKFMVRQGPNYSKHKRKDRNNGGSCYELRAMDWYKAGQKVDGVAKLATALPEAKFSHPSVPSLLVVNVQLPTEVRIAEHRCCSRACPRAQSRLHRFPVPSLESVQQRVAGCGVL